MSQVPACMHAQVLVDMSCGSGLFSRRFVRSGRFKGVVAADFSESMLTQAKEFFATDAALDPRYAIFKDVTIAGTILSPD